MEPVKEPLEGEDSGNQENNDECQEAGDIVYGEASCSQACGTEPDRPEKDPKEYKHDPNGIWRALKKAKRLGGSREFDLQETFAVFDTTGTGKIKPQLFITVLQGHIGYRTALTRVDIEKIAFFFEDQATNMVDYRSFIDFVEEPESPPPYCIIPPEMEEQLKSLPKNTAADNTERDAVSKILDYIAGVIMHKQILVESIWIDVEEFMGKELTHSQLKKIFAKLGIYLEETDLNMLCKFFGRNVLEFNLPDFLSELRRSMIKLKENSKYNPILIAENIGKKYKKKFPKQVKPDFRQSNMPELVQNCDIPHSSPESWLEMSEDTLQLITRIKKAFHVYGVLARPHFQQFDPFHSGRITIPQFLRALDECCVNIGGKAKLFITPTELQNLIELYTETNNPGFVVWKAFVLDIESAKCIQDLHRHPTADIRDHRPTGLRKIIDGLACKHARRYIMTAEEHRRTERIMEYIKNQLKDCNPYHFFRAFDKTNRQHLTRCQLREVLSQLNLKLSPKEFYDLEMYFLDIHGFCYMFFLRALGTVKSPNDIAPGVRLHKTYRFKKPKEGRYPPYENEATTGEEVLKKIRATVFERGLRLKYFLQQYDRHNTGIIEIVNFIRAINAAHNWAFTDLEFKKLIELFRNPFIHDSVNYKVFLDAIDNMYTQPDLHRSPLVNPIPFTGKKLMYEFKHREWLQFGRIIERLANLGISLHSKHAFQDFDKTLNSHAVTYNNYLRALENLGVLKLLSQEETKLIFEVYKRPHYHRYEFDYIRFLETCHNAGLSPWNNY